MRPATAPSGRPPAPRGGRPPVTLPPCRGHGAGALAGARRHARQEVSGRAAEFGQRLFARSGRFQNATRLDAQDGRNLAGRHPAMTHGKVAHRLAHADHVPPLGVGSHLVQLYIKPGRCSDSPVLSSQRLAVQTGPAGGDRATSSRVVRAVPRRSRTRLGDDEPVKKSASVAARRRCAQRTLRKIHANSVDP